MKSIQFLQALFTIHSNNFRMLHWKACGENFDSAHSIAGDYYDMVGADIDDIAEVMLRDDINPLTLEECLDAKHDMNISILDVKGDADYTKSEIIRFSGRILSDILNGILETLEEYQDDRHVGIKSYLEGLYDKYDKEANYLNKRRMKR